MKAGIILCKLYGIWINASAIVYFAGYDIQGVQGTIVFFQSAPSRKFPGVDTDSFAEHLTESVKEFAAFTGAKARAETLYKDPNAN